MMHKQNSILPKLFAPQISSALKKLDSERDTIFLRGLNIYAAESITRNRHVTTVLYSYENYLKDKANKMPKLAIKIKINVLALKNILFSEQEEPE